MDYNPEEDETGEPMFVSRGKSIAMNSRRKSSSEHGGIVDMLATGLKDVAETMRRGQEKPKTLVEKLIDAKTKLEGHRYMATCFYKIHSLMPMIISTQAPWSTVQVSC